ncbi:MAG TPA: sensor histidine kinase [Acidimicrobiales bacterium]|jgi:signal transduction histidine kinase
MDGATDVGDLPRPPFLERISARQWVTVDVVLAGLSFSGATVALLLSPDAANSMVVSRWILWPLVATATIPIAFRRRWPELALVCVGGALMVTAMLGQSFAPTPVLALPLYSVILKYSRRQSLMVLAVVEGLFLTGFIVAALLRPLHGDFTFDIILAGATWFVGDSVRTRRAYQRGLATQERERQRQELDRAERAVVEERMEIARELHDVIAHSLSVIAIQSGVGRHVIDNQPDDARAALAAIEETSRSALHELRRVLGVLRRGDQGGPELDPAPTLSDLDDLVDRVRGAGVPIELRFTGGLPSLPQGLELSVYRIVQEALTNVVKHARSAHTWVCLEYGPDQLVVSVTNAALGAGANLPDVNGSGLPTDHRDRHGIIGMKERAATFGGTLTAGSLPDGGFEVRALLPLREPA